MVNRQDAMIKILLDIRDQTKSFNYKKEITQIEDESNIDTLSTHSIKENDKSKDFEANHKDDYDPPLYKVDEDSLEFCYHCGAELKKKVKTCPECGNTL